MHLLPLMGLASLALGAVIHREGVPDIDKRTSSPIGFHHPTRDATKVDSPKNGAVEEVMKWEMQARPARAPQEGELAKRENHAVNLYSDSYFRGSFTYINYDNVQSNYCLFIDQNFGVSSIEWIPGPQKYCAFFTSDSCDGGHPYFVSSGPSLLDLEWNQDITTGRPWNDMIRSVRCYTYDPTHVKGKRHELAPTALATAPERTRAIAYAGSDHAVNLYQKHNLIGQFQWYTIDNVFAHDCINLYNDKGIGSVDFPSVLNGLYCHLYTDTICESKDYFRVTNRVWSGLNDYETSTQSIKCWISSDAAKREATVPASSSDQATTNDSPHVIEMFKDWQFEGGSYWWYDISDMDRGVCAALPSDAEISSIAWFSPVGAHCHMHSDLFCNSQDFLEVHDFWAKLDDWNDRIRSVKCWRYT